MTTQAVSTARTQQDIRGATSDSARLAAALNRSGLAREQVEDFSGAAHAFSQALGIIESSDDPRSFALLAPVLTNAGRVHRRVGNLEIAEEFCVDAIDVARALYPSCSRELAVARLELGLVYKSAGRSVDAEPLLWDSLWALQQTLGAGHVDTAAIWRELGEISYAGGRTAEAERYTRHAIQIRVAANTDGRALAADIAALATIVRAGETRLRPAV